MAVETPEFAQMVRRMIRAYGRRVADADEVDLSTMVELRDVVELAIADAVRGQRAQGASWARIANGVGGTRQAAQQRYGA